MLWASLLDPCQSRPRRPGGYSCAGCGLAKRTLGCDRPGS